MRYVIMLLVLALVGPMWAATRPKSYVTGFRGQVHKAQTKAKSRGFEGTDEDLANKLGIPEDPPVTTQVVDTIETPVAIVVPKPTKVQNDSTWEYQLELDTWAGYLCSSD